MKRALGCGEIGVGRLDAVIDVTRVRHKSWIRWIKAVQSYSQLRTQNLDSSIVWVDYVSSLKILRRTLDPTLSTRKEMQRFDNSA